MNEREKWLLGAFIFLLVLLFSLIIFRKRLFPTDLVSDAQTQEQINTLHPFVRPLATKFINAAADQGIQLRITQGYRSYAEQEKDYAQGRTAPGSIITYALPGQSFHNFGLAFDVECIVNGKATYSCPWDKIGALGKSFGFKWGGDFKNLADNGHFEMSYGLPIAEIKKIYDSGNLYNGYANLALAA